MVSWYFEKIKISLKLFIFITFNFLFAKKELCAYAAIKLNYFT